MGGTWSRGDTVRSCVGKNKAAAEGRTEGREESKAWESSFIRVSEIAMPGTRGWPDLGLAVGMPRKEEIKEDCGQVPAGWGSTWACGGVAKKHEQEQHWV